MADIRGLPYERIEFDRNARVISPPPIRPAGITDLIVISHGWHQNADGPTGADGMYRELIGNLVDVADGFGGRKVGVTGVFWPSDMFSDDLTFETTPNHGGAQALGASADLPLSRLRQRAREVAVLLGADPDTLEKQAVNARAGGPRAAEFLQTIRGGLNTRLADDETRREHQRLLSEDADDLVTSLKEPPDPPETADLQRRALALGGPGTILQNIYRGATSAIAQILNQAAYFELKTRAGVIGAELAKALNGDSLSGVRLHLVGHSFGARLVTACAAGLDKEAQSLTLLQGAFSHNSLGTGVGPQKVDGAFRKVLAPGKVAGPIAITHTWNDQAVGFIYAIASRASNDYAKAVLTTPSLGGASDIFGGMGANGALKIVEPQEGSHRDFDGKSIPTLCPRKANSLHCDFIKSHCDVAQVACARILAAAVAPTS